MKTKSFMKKLLQSYFIIAVIPLMILMAVSFTLKFYSVLSEAKKEQQSITNLISQQLESILDTMSFISLDIVADEGFIEGARGLIHSNSSYEESNDYLQASRRICSYSYTNAAYNIVYISTAGHYMTNAGYNNRYSYAYKLADGVIESQDWYPLVQHNYGQTVLMPVSDTVLPDVDTPALTMIRAVRDPGKIIGYLAVQIPLEELNLVFDVSRINEIGYLVLYNGSVIFQSEHFPNDQAEIEDTQAWNDGIESRYMVSMKELKKSDVMVFTVIPLRSMIKNALANTWQNCLFYMVLLVLAIFLIVCFSKQYSRPISDLVSIMQDITINNLNDHSESNAYEQYEETRALYEEFSKMRKRLDEMISNEVALKTLQSEERLHYLQSQINPHFLYNTLNVIGIMGMEGNGNAVYESCLKMSRLLRYSISEKNSSVVRFKEEIQSAKLYLDLMKLRFEDCFEYEIICDETLNEELFLRVMLQPFLENIFEHAFDPEHRSLYAVIQALAENGSWKIIIEDNGAGMEEQVLSDLISDIERSRQGISDSRNDSYDIYGIGIKNTLIRLGLYFGKEFDYVLENRDTGGFRVILTGRLRT